MIWNCLSIIKFCCLYTCKMKTTSLRYSLFLPLRFVYSLILIILCCSIDPIFVLSTFLSEYETGRSSLIRSYYPSFLLLYLTYVILIFRPLSYSYVEIRSPKLKESFHPPVKTIIPSLPS